MNRNWYAVYTRPQAEKKVSALLNKRKIENYLPLNRIYLGQGSRRKLVQEPLFPTFVFVYLSEAELLEIRRISDILNFVYWLGKPAVIKEQEIENIAHFTNQYFNILVEKTPVHSGGMIRISHEPSLKVDGEVMTVKNTRVRLTLPSLGFAITAESQTEAVEALRFKKEGPAVFN